MGYLNDYNTSKGIKTTAPSVTGGGYLQQYNSNPKPTVTATPKAPPKPALTPVQKTIQTLNTSTKKAGDLFQNVVKGVSALLVPPKILSPLPTNSAPITQPKILTIKPDQKKVDLGQLQSIGVANQSATIKTTAKTTQSQKQFLNTVNTISTSLQQKFPETARILKEVTSDPLNTKADIKTRALTVWNSIKDPVSQYLKVSGELMFNPPKDPSKRLGLELQRVSGAVGVAFTPITALFSAANEVPILGSLTKILTLPFLTAGETGKNVSDAVIDQLPISKQAKENLKPGVGEIVSLAAQFAVGKISDVTPKKMQELTKKFGEQDAKTIVSTAKQLAEQKKSIDVQKPSQTPEYIKPGENTPQELIGAVIKSGAEKTPEGKAVIRAATEAQKAGQNIMIQDKFQLTMDNVKTLGEDTKVYRGAKDQRVNVNRPNGITGGVSFSVDKAVADRFATRETGTVKEYTISKDAKVVDHSFLETLPKGEVQAFLKDNKIDVVRFDIPQGSKGEAELRVLNANVLQEPKAKLTATKTTATPKLAEGVRSKAIKNKLIYGFDKSFRDLPERDVYNMKDQRTKAVQFVLSNPDEAFEVAMGRKRSPSNILPEMVFSAVEDLAIEMKNVDVLRELATRSGLTLEASEMGARIRALAERNPDSAANGIRQVADARRAAIEKRTGKTITEATKKVAADIKKKIKAPDKYDWGQFIKSIEC